MQIIVNKDYFMQSILKPIRTFFFDFYRMVSTVKIKNRLSYNV